MTMSLSKHSHACVRIESGDTAIVLDPGIFSPEGELPAVLDGAAAVLITHEHADHVAPDAVRAAFAANPELRLYATAAVAGQFADQGDRVQVLEPGAEVGIGALTIRTYGGAHAVIHPLEPMGYIDNLGYLISDGERSVYHPGDSFVVPEAPVTTLLVPAHAPWSKTGEVVDFAIATRAAVAHPVHDGLLNDRGLGLVDRLVSQLAGRYGVGYERLAVGASTKV